MKMRFAKLLILAALIPEVASAQLTNMRDSTAAQLADFTDLSADRSNIASATLVGKTYFDKIGAYLVSLVNAMENRVYDVQDFATLAAAITATTADTSMLNISTRQSITVNTTISGQMSLHVNPNGRFNITAGDTLTIDTPMLAGAYQIFEGSGVVQFSGSFKEVLAVWFGEGSQGVNKAIQSLPSTGGRIVLTDTVTIGTSADSILINKTGVELVSQGYSANAGVNTQTSIVKNDTCAAITITQPGVVLRNIHVAAGTNPEGPGICVSQGRVVLENITVTGQGTYGIWVGRGLSGVPAANLWRMSNVVCVNNDSSGIYIHDDSGGAPDVNSGILVGADLRGNQHGLEIVNALDCEFYGVITQSNDVYGIKLSSGAKGHYIKAYNESNGTADGILAAGTEDNWIIGTRSSVSTSITDNGTDNRVVGRLGSINDMFWEMGNVAFDSLHIGQGTLSGLWKFSMNPSTRSLETSIIGTGSTPVSYIIKHANSGVANFQIEDGGLKIRTGALIDSAKVLTDTLRFYVGGQEYDASKH